MMHDQVRGNASRVSITATDATGTEQYHNVNGLPGEAFTEVMAVQQHGFSSHPPNGSHGIMVAMQGRRDLVMVLGGESPSHRPTNLPAGASEQYDTGGSSVYLDADGRVAVTAPKSITLTVGTSTIVITDGEVVITAPGGTTVNGPLKVKGNSKIATGATGTFTSQTGRTVTVIDGLITDIF